MYKQLNNSRTPQPQPQTVLRECTACNHEKWVIKGSGKCVDCIDEAEELKQALKLSSETWRTKGDRYF